MFLSPSLSPFLHLPVSLSSRYLAFLFSPFLPLLLAWNNNLRLGSHSSILRRVETVEREKEEEIERCMGKAGKTNVLLLLPIDNGWTSEFPLPLYGH